MNKIRIRYITIYSLIKDNYPVKALIQYSPIESNVAIRGVCDHFKK